MSAAHDAVFKDDCPTPRCTPRRPGSHPTREPPVHAEKPTSAVRPMVRERVLLPAPPGRRASDAPSLRGLPGGACEQVHRRRPAIASIAAISGRTREPRPSPAEPHERSFDGHRARRTLPPRGSFDAATRVERSRPLAPFQSDPSPKASCEAAVARARERLPCHRPARHSPCPQSALRSSAPLAELGASTRLSTSVSGSAPAGGAPARGDRLSARER